MIQKKSIAACVSLMALLTGGENALRAQVRAPESSPSITGVTAQRSASASSPDQSGFAGSVPQGTASATPISLSLGDALNRGLRFNLGVLTSEEASKQVRAERYRALSLFLPNVTGQVGKTVEQVNLQTLGISFNAPGFRIPNIVGPFSYDAAVANATVPLFNWGAIQNYRASRQDREAAALSVKNARDLVVQAVGNAYLLIIADNARILATQAEIDADQAVYTNAVHRHDAGVAIAIDVLRSQVELKQRQQQLVAEQNRFEKDKLTLGRIIGLAVGQDFVATDPSADVPLTAVSLPDALQKAYANRSDYQAAKARVIAAEFSLRAAHAEHYPTLGAQGFYGDEGRHEFTNSHGVFTATIGIQFSIFDGGRIHADVLESSSELRNRRNEMENLRGQIDLDVRSALLDLKSAGDQVDVAKANQQLASETMKESRDRFTAGVTNTVEVVQAQQAVADANENLISAQYQYNVAKVSLARAQGLAEESMKAYFK